MLHVTTAQELRNALTKTTGAQNGDTVIFDADITLIRDLPAVQNSITINGNGHSSTARARIAAYTFTPER